MILSTENILFNELKHHLHFIINYVGQYQPNLIEDLQTIGSSLTDVYTGNLTVVNIKHQIINYLHKNHIFYSDDYCKWINEDKCYRIVKTEDNTNWILRISDNKEKIIHIHPGRDGKNIFRVKGETIKTAIAFVYYKNYEKQSIELNKDVINDIRIKLNISPVKHFEKTKILTFISLLNSIQKNLIIK